MNLILGYSLSAMETKKKSIRVKVWIEDEKGETFFGAGQLKMLKAIDQYGSISAAAKQMKMGYRSMWGKLKKIEDRLGRRLLIREKGGTAGGSSKLTPEAHELVEKFSHLNTHIQEEAGAALQTIFD